MRCHVGIARHVVLDLTGLGVRIPIDLDAQPGLGAVEVGDEPAEERMLTAKVNAELMVAHGGPDALFGAGRLVAGFARVAQEGRGQTDRGRVLGQS